MQKFLKTKWAKCITLLTSFALNLIEQCNNQVSKAGVDIQQSLSSD